MMARALDLALPVDEYIGDLGEFYPHNIFVYFLKVT
jgi:hypothetical protein